MVLAIVMHNSPFSYRPSPFCCAQTPVQYDHFLFAHSSGLAVRLVGSIKYLRSFLSLSFWRYIQGDHSCKLFGTQRNPPWFTALPTLSHLRAPRDAYFVCISFRFLLNASYLSTEHVVRVVKPPTCRPNSIPSHSIPLDSVPKQALGTSYVNELDSQKALTNLKAWVEHNPKYSGLEIAVDEYSDGTLMDEVCMHVTYAHGT